ncbi:transposase [Streptomyces sp. NPDC017993]|uniref:transposase n=1 Tax=Streptomyces sp. NPDC017993 TaxID=3365027 RepID=UPI0037B6B396
MDTYADQKPQRGKTLLTTLIDLLRSGLPAGLDELAQLGRTLHRRREDVLDHFEHRASNGLTEPSTATSKRCAPTPSLSQHDQLPDQASAALRAARTPDPEEPTKL